MACRSISSGSVSFFGVGFFGVFFIIGILHLSDATVHLVEPLSALPDESLQCLHAYTLLAAQGDCWKQLAAD